jgi:flagellar protein FlaG
MQIGNVSSTSYTPQTKAQNLDKDLPELKKESADNNIKHQDQPIEVRENVSKEKLEEVVKSMNQFLMPTNTSLKFTMHEDLKEYYVQIVDEKTKEVIREIPSKKMLDMYAAMKDLLGLVVDRKI